MRFAKFGVNGSVGEWPKPTDCKSVLNRALVRIQSLPPDNVHDYLLYCNVTVRNVITTLRDLQPY